MSVAKEHQDTWFYIPRYVQKRQIDHVIKDCRDYIIHEVNKLVVFEWFGHFQVINIESYVVKFFDTEKEAMDYCLDFYSESFINEQLDLFKK